jgi:hypothetical protein
MKRETKRETKKVKKEKEPKLKEKEPKVKTVKELKVKPPKEPKLPKVNKREIKKRIEEEKKKRLYYETEHKRNPFINMQNKLNKTKKMKKKDKKQMEIEKNKMLIEFIDHQTQGQEQFTREEPLKIKAYEYKVEVKNGKRMLMGKPASSKDWLRLM